MQHAEFIEGNILFDTLHCREVKVEETYHSSDDLKSGEVFVNPLRDDRPPYTINKKHLYSTDELSKALAHQDIDEILNEMRRDRLLEEAPLLQYVEFDPDEITEDVIIDLKNIEVEISRIDNHMRRKLTKAYFSGELESTDPGDILEYACAVIIKDSKKDAHQRS